MIKRTHSRPVLARCIALATIACGLPPTSQTPRAVPAPADPPPFPVWEATITDLQTAMASGRVTSQQLVGAYLNRIDAYDKAGPALNALIRLNPVAIAEAAALDLERKERGPRGPLHGIPIVIKDNYDTRDMPTSAGSISLAGLQPDRDAFVVARLRAAGAVLLGKTNMMEFAMGTYTVSSIVGATRNPYDPTRSPGGSSGGTGAAVAASLAAVGWGTDTCGSLRVPAAFNSLFALRPTKGITSTQGIVPLCRSQDVAGAMARTATDLAIALDASIGLDTADPDAAQWTGRALPHFVAALDSTALRGARLGVLKEFFGDGSAEREVSDTVRSALARMRAGGAQLINVSIPGLDSLAISGNLVAFEFRDNLATYLRGKPNAPVTSLSDILARGLYLAELQGDYQILNTNPDTSSPAYATAMAQRAVLRNKLRQLLVDQHLDALVYPTVRTGPSFVGARQTDPNCEASANSGFPAFSAPVGFTRDGLPVGMEMLGAPSSDARLVAMGFAWERLASPRRAPLYTPPLDARGAPLPHRVQMNMSVDSMTATAVFTFDAPTGRLSYVLTINGLPKEQLLAASLHQGADTTSDGPVIAVIASPGTLKSQGSLTLQFPARDALHQGLLYVTILTSQHPRGAVRGRIPPPGGPPIFPVRPAISPLRQ